MHMYDVVVIGAGAAGLTAAQQLLRANVQNIVVLEAQQYVGGRIRTYHDWGRPIELGAEFIHGSNTVTAQMARELHMETIAAHEDRKLVDAQGTALSHQQRQQYHALLEYVSHHGQQGVPIADVIAKNPVATDPTIRQLVALTIADYEAGDADKLDSGAFTDMERYAAHDGGTLLLRDGYQRIVQHLMQDVPIRLQSVVRFVDYTDAGKVLVHLEDGETITAQQVAVTVSLGVLQHGRILFMPALPEEKQAAIVSLGMGNAIKVLVRFKDPHDVASLFHYADGENESLQTISCWWASASDPRVLVGYAGGSRAAAALALPEQRLYQKVVADLSAVFGSSLADNIIDYKIVRWDTNPYSYGAYSNHPVGTSLHDRKALAAPVDGRLFWAGEATMADASYATVHGAIASGYRAADEVLAAYGG